jgi:STE24 endopeptidase
VFAVAWLVAAWLLWSSSEVPSLHLPHVDVGALAPPGELHAADSYDHGAALIALLGIVIELAVFIVYAWLGPGFTRESAAGPVGTGLLLGMLGFGLLWIAEVPTTVLGIWWDRRHDVGHESYVHALLGGWLLLGFEFVLLCIALAIVMGFARLVGDWWWLLAVPVFVALIALDVFVAPYLQPTHPVEDPSLQRSIAQLEKREGTGHLNVRIQVVSDETSFPNAETEGIGPSKRVVIWDTLLDGRFSPGEVRVVLAHEFGHAKRNHIVKAIAWYALFAFLFAFIVSRVVRRRGGMGEPAAVPLAILTLIVLQLIALPVQNAISRHMEAEADWLALQTTRDPKDATSLFSQFISTALSNPNPPTWEYLLFEDHPTIAQRVAMVRAWKARQATSASSSAPSAAHSP